MAKTQIRQVKFRWDEFGWLVVAGTQSLSHHLVFTSSIVSSCPHTSLSLPSVHPLLPVLHAWGTCCKLAAVGPEG